MPGVLINTTALPPDRATNSSGPGGPGGVDDSLQLQLRLIISFLVLLGFFIVCINSYVVYLVAKVDRLKTVPNFCLTSMAVSDMLSGLVVIPLIAWCSLEPPKAPGDQRFVAMDLVQRFLSISTILHLLLITLERYITIVHMFSQSNSLFGKRSCVLILLGLWAFSLMASLVQLTFLNSQHQGNSVIIYDVVMLVGIVALPLIVMVFAYGHIFHTLRRHCKNIKRDISHLQDGSAERYRQKERRAIMIYGTMLIVFVIGWFNYFLTTLQDDLGGGHALPLWASALLMFLRFSTSFLNPLLYTFLKYDFKQARRSVRLFPCSGSYQRVARHRSTTKSITASTTL